MNVFTDIRDDILSPIGLTSFMASVLRSKLAEVIPQYDALNLHLTQINSHKGIACIELPLLQLTSYCLFVGRSLLFLRQHWRQTKWRQ